jgi:superfamily II DNA/RNA helicase
MARLAANGTYLVDKKKPGFSTKLSVLEDLLTDLIAIPDRKIVLFSEWKVMLDLIEPMLKKLRCKFVRLDGSVPQKYRPSIVRQFQNEPQCRLIMMTNAGSTGLNLQSANTVINVDLPWNPAVLEQRIARAHRMGQQNPVHVYKLVTESTIEEKLLDVIASKQELANAAIDFDSDVEFVTMKSSITNIRERLEKILAPHATATPNANQEVLARKEVKEIEEKREKVAMAGGQLLGAALGLLSELVKQKQEHPPQEAVVQKIADSLQDCVERDELGRPQLTVRLENEEALRNLASSLAHLLLGAKS